MKQILCKETTYFICYLDTYLDKTQKYLFDSYQSVTYFEEINSKRNFIQ